ncbi:transposable element Tcb2 transposase [Trichonephila clavipes]|nr:transposable element Tcb2 transposase [Trichonephila clavipes]
MSSKRRIVVPYTAAIGEDVMLIDDNGRPNHDNLADGFLFEKGITLMKWLACSPDLNPIEHVWEILSSGRLHPSQTILELEKAILEK